MANNARPINGCLIVLFFMGKWGQESTIERADLECAEEAAEDCETAYLLSSPLCPCLLWAKGI